jgi:hypothetical protein
MSHGQRHGRIFGSQDFPTDRNVSPMALYAMQMDWVNNLTPEEKQRFDNQLCINCGQAGHIKRYCPMKPVYSRPAGPLAQRNNNNIVCHNGAPQHNMGG